MIKFTLKCAREHSFDSWFQSSDAFAKLLASGMVECPACGETTVEKAIMSPRVTAARANKPALVALTDTNTKMHALTTPSSPAEAAFKEMREKIQKTSEYVGTDFVAEARAIHDGDAPERSIYGEADAKEAKKLLEDGISVLPLPFIPLRKTN